MLCSWSAPSTVVSVADPYLQYTAAAAGQQLGSLILGATLSIPSISLTAASTISIVDFNTVTIAVGCSCRAWCVCCHPVAYLDVWIHNPVPMHTSNFLTALQSAVSFTVKKLFFIKGGLFLSMSTLNGGSIRGAVQSVGTFYLPAQWLPLQASPTNFHSTDLRAVADLQWLTRHSHFRSPWKPSLLAALNTPSLAMHLRYVCAPQMLFYGRVLACIHTQCTAD